VCDPPLVWRPAGSSVELAAGKGRLRRQCLGRALVTTARGAPRPSSTGSPHPLVAKASVYLPVEIDFLLVQRLGRKGGRTNRLRPAPPTPGLGCEELSSAHDSALWPCWSCCAFSASGQRCGNHLSTDLGALAVPATAGGTYGVNHSLSDRRVLAEYVERHRSILSDQY
jgi:hypothetical protein